MGALKPAKNSFPYIPIFLHISRQFVLFQSSISEYARPVSLGPAVLREWALRKLVGAIAAASRAGQAGRTRISLSFLANTFIIILVFFAVVISGSVFETIASACNCNNFGMVQEPVQNCCSRRNITKQFTPIFQRSV